jgi:hypothetical protein
MSIDWICLVTEEEEVDIFQVTTYQLANTSQGGGYPGTIKAVGEKTVYALNGTGDAQKSLFTISSGLPFLGTKNYPSSISFLFFLSCSFFFRWGVAS